MIMFNQLSLFNKPLLPSVPNSIFDGFFQQFDELFSVFDNREESWNPRLDVEEAPEQYTIRLEAPGASKEDVTVNVQNGILKIVGTRNTSRETKDDKTGASSKESYFERFSRNIPLGKSVDQDNIVAEMKDGLLTVVLPRIESDTSRKIDIQ